MRESSRMSVSHPVSRQSRKRGTQIISLNDEMHEQIRELCKPVYESIEKNVSEDLVDAYLGDMKGVIE